MRVLVVEDDNQVMQQMVGALSNHGYAVDAAEDGSKAWFLGDTEEYDAVVLDLGLPELDGLSVLNRWRQAGNRVPVLVLTARDTWRDKVRGLRTGADDYMAKPFEMEEMLARVEALIRRSAGHASPVIESGPLSLDPATRQVTLNGDRLELTTLEYRMLAYMIHHEGVVLSKSVLIEHIYGQDFDRDSNVIEVLINRLRKKVGADFIKTHRGQGYQLTV